MKVKSNAYLSKYSIGLAMAGVLFAGTAGATEGYFQNGVGARHKAMAGAGVADAKDATTIALNPAGLVDAGHELDLALSWFSPDRGYTGTGQGFTPSGTIEGNETSFFLVPDIAYSRPVGAHGAFGFSLDGNGGMNTDYAAVDNPACAQPGLPGTDGLFCGGESGVDLTQAFIYVAYAHEFGPVSVGVAPVFAVQAFEAKGIAAFGGVSSDPTALTNNDHDFSTGFGVRLGVNLDLAENFRVGASYQTEIDMEAFDDYAGLFASGGDFDIPQNFQVGVAFDVTDKLTVLADYRSISYSDVDAIANPQTAMMPLGADGGPGFHWSDVETVKFGLEYAGDNGWTWRAGYSNNNNPVPSDAVTFNIFAPGVVTNHFTAGFEKDLTEKQTLQAAFMYAPEETVSGIEITPFGPNPNQNIELYMKQYEVTVGWTYKFGK